MNRAVGGVGSAADAGRAAARSGDDRSAGYADFLDGAVVAAADAGRAHGVFRRSCRCGDRAARNPNTATVADGSAADARAQRSAFRDDAAAGNENGNLRGGRVLALSATAANARAVPGGVGADGSSVQFDAAHNLAPVVGADVRIIVNVAHVEAARTDAGPAAEGVFAIYISEGRAAGGVEDAGEALRDADQSEIDAVAAVLVLAISADACASAVGAAHSVSIAALNVERAVSEKIQLPAGIRVIIPIGVIGGRYAYTGKAAAAGETVFAHDRQFKRRACLNPDGRLAGCCDLQVGDGDILRSALDHNGLAARTADDVGASRCGLRRSLLIARLRDIDGSLGNVKLFCERTAPCTAEYQNCNHQHWGHQSDERSCYQEKNLLEMIFFPWSRKARQRPDLGLYGEALASSAANVSPETDFQAATHFGWERDHLKNELRLCFGNRLWSVFGNALQP